MSAVGDYPPELLNSVVPVGRIMKVEYPERWPATNDDLDAKLDRIEAKLDALLRGEVRP